MNVISHRFIRAAQGLLLAASLIAVAAAQAQAETEAEAEQINLRGHVGFEAASYPRFLGEGGARNPTQADSNLALRAQVEASYAANPHTSFALRGFLRQDADNAQRNAARWDEAWVQYAAPQWDVRVGNQWVTWGSVESVSALDIVNPRDYEEDMVEPRKIGLLMGRFRWRLPSSDLSVYWLPRYEPTHFAGSQSYFSLAGGLPQVNPASRHDASQWAARYFRSVDSLDIGVSYFSGLERNPAFEFDPAQGAMVGRTYATRRWGVEVARTVGSAVLKGEFVYRPRHSGPAGSGGQHRALLYVVGAEYTVPSVWRHSELTLFAEYLGSSHNVEQTELMQNDAFIALRWTLNDRHRQRLQVGTFRDLSQGNAHIYRAEYLVSPQENIDVTLSYTHSRNYYPGPRHLEPRDGVFYLLAKYNF